jgi:NADP-dependent 3-hydroxy acid dehydrogenase YdfG
MTGASSPDVVVVDTMVISWLRLDITDPESVAAAPAATDVTLLVNNAGSATSQNLITGDMDQIRLEMETNVTGVTGRHPRVPPWVFVTRAAVRSVPLVRVAGQAA